MGASSLPTSVTWLDLGAGDGNVVPAISALGVDRIVALEYQAELLDVCPPDAARVVGSADRIPLHDASIGVTVAMDVLHHLTSRQLDHTLAELARVTRPGGHVLVCEPAPTKLRSALQVALMSRLSELSSYTRNKRRMVELEADTLVPWLEDEPELVGRAADAGFRLEATVRRPLHTMRRFARR